MSTDFRKIINARIEELRQTHPEINRLWLARKMEEHCHKTQIYAYLTGRNDMRSENIARIFDILGLDVVTGREPKAGKKKLPTPPKMPLE